MDPLLRWSYFFCSLISCKFVSKPPQKLIPLI